MTIQTLLGSKSYAHKKVLEKLIAHRLGHDVTRVLAHLNTKICDEDILWIQKSYHAYTVQKQPIEYILGYVEFFGNRFMVDNNTLIPRPETEYMITTVIKHLKQPSFCNDANNKQKTINTLIDVGTGCGVLGISCALHAGTCIHNLYLTEYYPKTLEVAKKNLNYYIHRIYLFITKKQEYFNIDSQQQAILHTLENTKLIQCSLLDHPILQDIIVSTNDTLGTNNNIIIVANLPYIPNQLFEDHVEDNVKLREPKAAFVGGEDGLDWYREMLTQIIKTRKTKYGFSPLIRGGVEGGCVGHQQSVISNSLILFLEMMTRQVDILAREFSEYFSFEEVATFHMNIRIVKVLWKG